VAGDYRWAVTIVAFSTDVGSPEALCSGNSQGRHSELQSGGHSLRAMQKVRRLSRRKVALLIATVVAVVAIVGGLVSGGVHATANTTSSSSASVLSPAYARSVGFTKTYRAAAKQAVTNEKGCSTSVESIYENTTGETGLISDYLRCKSTGAASAVLTSFRKQVHIDRAIRIPSQLGKTAFATASDAPEYLVAWQVGSGVALLAVDTDIAATSNSATATPITTSETKVLVAAAVQQNSLYD